MACMSQSSTNYQEASADAVCGICSRRTANAYLVHGKLSEVLHLRCKGEEFPRPLAAFLMGQMHNQARWAQMLLA
jgi:hypothetical protein